MRFVIILIIALATASCASKQRAGSPSSRLAGPTLAQQQAEAYLATLPIQPTSSERQELEREFIRMFFSGFTAPEASLIGNDAAERGFEAGQKFRRQCGAREIEQTMKAYGYVATEATGTWSVGFEQSCFRPSNTSEQAWWLSELGNTQYTLPKKEEQTDQPILYRISGFLSPKGEYGHLGGYSHEFYATKIVYIKGSR